MNHEGYGLPDHKNVQVKGSQGVRQPPIHISEQYIINPEPEFKAILGAIPLLFTTFWGDRQPAVNRSL